ncbi:hypothetical protein DXP75_06760 [Listeria monocytogenes]|nr:hypothetical protein [Listeria monocytogenes]MCX81737.1 hypothetical protein [Listeria monocytogenes]
MTNIYRMSEKLENGDIEAYYPETHKDAVLGLEQLDELAVNSGWLPLTMKNGFTKLASAPPEYLILGLMVYFRGCVERTNNLKGVFATMPVGARTKINYLGGMVLSQRSSGAGASATVYTHTNGDLELLSTSNDAAIWLNGLSYPLI